MKARNFYLIVLLISVFLLAAVRSDASKSPLAGERATAAAPAKQRQLRIIAFGAHPDDCELQASGTGALWAAKGHHVKFVSVTSGDIGHWRDAGGPLALRNRSRREWLERSASPRPSD